MLTVDVPQVAPRRRDLRNGFGMPFRIGPKQFIDFGPELKTLLMQRFQAPEPMAGILRPLVQTAIESIPQVVPRYNDSSGNLIPRLSVKKRPVLKKN